MPAQNPGDIPDFEEALDALFGGVSAPDGKFAKACEDTEGEVVGVGPNCSRFEEEGNRDAAMCFYDNALDLIIELRTYVHPRCQKIVELRLSETVDTAAIMAIEAEIEAKNEEFADDVEKLADECECRQCMYEITKRPPKEEEDPDAVEEEEVDPDIEDNSTFEQVKTSSTYSVIPRIFGRYVTSGNIIWIGNQTTTAIEYTKQLNDGENQLVQDTVDTVDILVGLAIGPLSHVMRIWLGDAIVYNATVNVDDAGTVQLSDTNNASSDINISALLSDDYNMERLVAFKPTVEFYSGSAAQKAIASYSVEEGFGRVPAHRGLSTLLLKDIDLALFGGSFPDIRVDVIANAPEDILPRFDAAALGLINTVDQRAAMIVAKDTDDVVLIDYGTMVERYRGTPADNDYMLPLISGNVLIQGAETSVLDPYRNTLSQSEVIGPIGPASAVFLGYDAETYAHDIALVAADDGAFDIVRYNYSTKTLTVLDSVTGDVNYEAFSGLITRIDGITYYYQFTLASPTQNSLRIRRFAMTDIDTIVDPAPTMVTYDIDGEDFWGPLDTGLTVQALLCNADNSILCFIPGADKVAKISNVGEIVWTADAPDLPSELSGLLSISPYYYYVGSTTGDVTRITLEDGTIEVVGNTFTEFSSLPTGVQYFDGNAGSVLYVDAANQMFRIFPDKLVSAPTSIGEIFDGLVQNTPLTSEFFDTSDVQDVVLRGYYIDSAASIPDVLSALGELYQVSIVDTGTKLVALKSQTITTPITVPADDILAESLQITRVLASEKFQVARAKFFNIDDFGLVEINQAVTLRPDTEETDYASADFTAQLNDDPENVRRHLEKVIMLRVAAARKVSVELMPRALGLVPSDRITIGEDTYRLESVLDGAAFQSSVDGVYHDQTALETEVEIDAVPIYGGLSVKKPVGQLPYRPVVLFTNALTDEDAQRCFTGQVVYTGLDVPTRTDIEPTRFTMRIDPPPNPPTGPVQTDESLTYPPILRNSASPLYTTAIHTEGVHVGVVDAVPLNTFPSEYQTDEDSELVIVFQHADTVDYFVSGAGVGILETPTSNLLLVGNELIQFEDFAVDMDGVTVTFSNLHRGRFGTSQFMFDHVVGETAYLYTAASFKPMVIDPVFTVNQSRARTLIRATAVAGAVMLPYMTQTDAGSARPYGPSPIKRLELGDDPLFAAINWHLRRSFSVPLLENLGNLPNEWTFPGIVVAQLQRLPTSMEEWNTEFVQHYYTDFTFDSSLVFTVNQFDSQGPVEWGYVGTDILLPENGDPFILAVMQTRDTEDANNVPYTILGHPTFWVFEQGTYPDFA